jgi:ornithine carbamoyltransferase
MTTPTTRTSIPTVQHLPGKDLLTLADLSDRTVLELFDVARRMKQDMRPYHSALAGVTAIMLFEKASLRTRVSFQAGIAKLGGTTVYMDHTTQKLGERESVKDYAKNLERWVDCIIARVYSQTVLEELSEHCKVPVINALSDRYHPCQALADLFTLQEKFPNFAAPEGGKVRLAYIGDGNNVCHSLMHAATMLGVDLTVVTPKGYEPSADVVTECGLFAAHAHSKLKLSHDPAAVAGHHAVYTDVWVSMGQADTAGKRRKAFQHYQVNAALMAKASERLVSPSLFMHCLPAQRGVEVTDEVLDSPSSVVYDQAENRMWAQNALLLGLFSKGLPNEH